MSIDRISNEFGGDGPLLSYSNPAVTPDTFDFGVGPDFGTRDFSDTFGFRGDGPLRLYSNPAVTPDTLRENAPEVVESGWDAGLDTADAVWDGLKGAASDAHGAGQNLFDGAIRRSFVLNPYPGDAQEAWGETLSSGLDTLGIALDFGILLSQGVQSFGQSSGHLFRQVLSLDIDGAANTLRGGVENVWELNKWAAHGLRDAFESNFLTDGNGDGRLADDRTRNSLLLGAGVLGVGAGYKLLKNGPELLDAAGDVSRNANSRVLEPLEEFHDSIGEKMIGTAKGWAEPINQRAINWERNFWERKGKPFFEGLKPDAGTWGRNIFDSASDGFNNLGSRYDEAISRVNARLEPHFDSLKGSLVYRGILDNGYKVGATVFNALETGWTRTKYIAGAGIAAGLATGDVNVYVNDDDVVKKFNVYPGGWNVTVEFEPTGTYFGVNANTFYARPPWAFGAFEDSAMPTLRFGSEPGNPGGPKGLTGIDAIRVNGPQVGVHAQWAGTNEWAVRSWFSLPFSPFLFAGYSWPTGQFQMSGRLDIPVDPRSREGFHIKNTASTVRPQYISGFFGPGWSVVNKDVDFADLATIGGPTKEPWAQVGPFKFGGKAQHGSSSVLSINPSHGVPEPTDADWNLGTWVNSLLPDSLQGYYGSDSAYDPALNNTQRTDQTYLDWLNSDSDLPPPLP